MISTVLLACLLVIAVSSLSALGLSCAEHPLNVQIEPAQRDFANVLAGLYRVAMSNQVCLGIDADDAGLLKGPAHISGAAVTVGQSFRELLLKAPGYCAVERDRILEIRRCQERRDEALNIRIPVFRSFNPASVQDLSNLLFVSVVRLFSPRAGIAGDYPGGRRSRMIGPYNLRNRSVREILVRLASDGVGVWLATSVPINRGGSPGRFWTVFEYADDSVFGLRTLDDQIRTTFMP